MTDMRGRHGRNFEGTILTISGDDTALNSMLDRLEYILGANVLSRRDTEPGQGFLTIQTQAYVKSKIAEIARELKLQVAG